MNYINENTNAELMSKFNKMDFELNKIVGNNNIVKNNDVKNNNVKDNSVKNNNVKNTGSSEDENKSKK